MKKFTTQKVEAFRRLGKKVARAEGIPYSHALDGIAKEHGFKNWSMLQKKGLMEQESRDSTSPQPQLSDFVRDNRPPREAGEGTYLLRYLEGAPVALYRSRPGGVAEIVPTRRDLFQYEGGFGWGYRGSGAQNLCFALAGKLFGRDRLSNAELAERALALLDNVISRLSNSMEYELSEAELRRQAIQAAS